MISGTTPSSSHAARATSGRELAEPQSISQPFRWAVGIESSTLPQLDVDQFEWTQHNLHWLDDLKRVREELGLTQLRYAIPWQYIEPSPGRFDFAISDERIGACVELGIELTLDVMHFGTPRWMTQAVGDPEFPERLETLAQAMAERYGDRVGTWCPVNEPLVTSLFSGDFGFWPPHGRQWRGYMPVLSRVALGTSRAIRAIRRARPEATVMLCDAADHFASGDESLAAEVELRNLRRFLVLDLISGRVDEHHPLRRWLLAYGASELDLRWFADHPQSPDVIGLDYYPHSDWTLDRRHGNVRQRRAESPAGLYRVASQYHDRYGLPLAVTETSIEGKPINREIWLERIVEDARRLRADGVPMIGMVWWPLFDHLDWDGALTHRIGKLHQVGLYKLVRDKGGRFRRQRTPLADAYAALAAGGDDAVGPIERWALPAPSGAGQRSALAGPADTSWNGDAPLSALGEPSRAPAGNSAGPTGSNGRAPRADRMATDTPTTRTGSTPGRYGIVVFCHLRWGFVWQRPQQFISRLARRHPVLFVEEPCFDLPTGGEPRVDLHQVMPNVTVVCPHCPSSWMSRVDLGDRLLDWTRRAIERVNAEGAFDRPLLWYYSPMDAAWSLGRIENRGVVYDCMDELSQFSGAPPQLVANERRLMRHADVVFTGGQELYVRKAEQHPNTHFFGCGVEHEHFGLAMDDATTIPPDIDFMPRPILGWFGVVDERVDYHLIGEMARLRPDWSFAMVGPVVKVDPNLLPHAPNLFWLGGRDYGVLPNYCRAFDVCMMCFAINEATQYINPTKALEYLATGRPVIATPVRDVVRQYSELIDIAATPAELIAAAERAMARPDRDRIERGLALARSSGWDATVKRMQRLIAEAIVGDDRRSAKPVTPPDDACAMTGFAATPGS